MHGYYVFVTMRSLVLHRVAMLTRLTRRVQSLQHPRFAADVDQCLAPAVLREEAGLAGPSLVPHLGRGGALLICKATMAHQSNITLMSSHAILTQQASCCVFPNQHFKSHPKQSNIAYRNMPSMRCYRDRCNALSVLARAIVPWSLQQEVLCSEA